MQIGMLGPFEVRGDDGRPIDVPGARLRALLIALALTTGHATSRASLIDWIWGENPPKDASNSLHRLVSRLRTALPEGMVEGRADGYRLTVDPNSVDAVRFERLVAESQSGSEDGPRRVRLLSTALDLWRGNAMQEVALQNSAAFEAAGTRLDSLRLNAMEDLFEAEITLGRGAELVTRLTDLVAAYPMRERLVAALMRSLVAAGRETDALLLYQRTRETLSNELGVDPSPELAALHVALLRGEVRQQRREDRRTNLRAELTSFVGKDADIAAIRALITEHRLTTLIGPGGAGKTRLAAETTRTLLDETDEAWLVELAAIGAGGDVGQAALAGLDLRDALLGGMTNAEPTDRFIAAVREREALLVLDNCEHVIESAAVFAHRVLGECPRLRILATSREPLGITGEALWLVEPLAVPERDDPAEIEASAAVRLLLDRSSVARKDLVVDATTLVTMARVCRALDGMPLAIELAAARLRTMSLDQLAHRLDDRFRLLTGGSRTALPHHKTLRAMVDWSWELLSDAERVVLRRLSVFASGADLEAAERVCAGAQVEAEQVLDLLTSLVEKSLLRTGDDGALRYRMLGTIEEYARRRLAESGEAELARHAHLAHFTELAETADPHLRRAGQLDWLATLAAEHDNIGTAMRGALAAGEAHAAMRLAARTGWYYWLSGHKAEGIELLIAATETPGEVPDEVRAIVYALIVLFVSSGLGDEYQAAEWIYKSYRFRESSRSPEPLLGLVVPLVRMLQEPNAFLPAFEPLLDNEDPWVRALTRLQLGKMRIVLGQGGRDADAYLEMALAEFRALGERFGISFALIELADRIATRGELARACELYDQAVEVVSELGAIEDAMRMRSRQAQLYWVLGDRDASAAASAEAQRYADQVTWPDALAALSLAKAELSWWGGNPEESRHHLRAATTMLGRGAEAANIRAVTHDLLGYLAEDLDEARSHHEAAYLAATETGHASTIAKVLVGVADLALRREHHEQAARLLGASAGVRGLPDRSHPDAVRIERAARSRLGEARFTEATHEGTRENWADLATAVLGL